MIFQLLVLRPRPSGVTRSEIWTGVTIAGQTTEQGKIGLLSQWTMEGSDEQKRYHQNSEREEPGGKAKASSYSLSKTVSIFALLGLGLSTYILWMVQHVVCVGVQCTHIC